jgi:hypothetical protein
MANVVEDLRRVVQGLVDEPDQVEIDEEDLGETTVLRVTVHPDELGRIIGRQGSTVKALRTLLEVRGATSRHYYELEVDED